MRLSHEFYPPIRLRLDAYPCDHEVTGVYEEYNAVTKQWIFVAGGIDIYPGIPSRHPHVTDWLTRMRLADCLYTCGRHGLGRNPNKAYGLHPRDDARCRRDAGHVAGEGGAA